MDSAKAMHEEKLLADARNSLLKHYSSKSTNQTAIILALAVAFFSVMGFYLNIQFTSNWQRILFLTLTVIPISFGVFRAAGRLISWGELAASIMCVRMLEEWETHERMKNGIT